MSNVTISLRSGSNQPAGECCRGLYVIAPRFHSSDWSRQPITQESGLARACQIHALHLIICAVVDISTCTLIFTGLVAGVASYIPWQQWRTARNRLRLIP